ncbi:unnamed protein product [Hermetia illucens]|uniref:Uncharacterized protein n=1 Tax=Hermetia illucens TaxID=343691 RepID=A0A7R8Z380_HERIL|nr:unnamed protein product [Hermetia illucens]
MFDIERERIGRDKSSTCESLAPLEWIPCIVGRSASERSRTRAAPGYSSSNCDRGTPHLKYCFSRTPPGGKLELLIIKSSDYSEMIDTQ